MRRLGVGLLVLLLAWPLSAAHPGDEYPVVQSSAEGLSGFLTIQTMVLMAGRESNFTLGVYDASTYVSVMSAASAFLEREGTPSREVPLALNASGERTGSVLVDARGHWRLRVLVNDSAVLTFPFEAYPLASHRAASNDARYRLFYAEDESAIGVAFVDVETGLPDAGVRSGEAVIERWSASFESKQGEEEVALVEGALPGELLLRHRFGSAGAFALRFGSRELGIQPSDLPPFRIIVHPGQDPDAPARAVSGSPLVAAAFVVALTGLAFRGWRKRE